MISSHKICDIFTYITSLSQIKDKEKRLFGEVFTPLNLIEELLDKLPVEIWINPKLKWLEPASGLGQFSICVFNRLMNSLEDIILNIDERKNHIIKNMLYMAELNKTNIDITKKIFGNEINLYEGDYLQLNSEIRFNTKEFDVILGNPPYNKGGIFSCSQKQLGEKNETVWPLFIKKSFSLLKKNGYLLFINPLSWLRKSHSVHNLLLEKNIIWLKLWDGRKTFIIFKANIPISIYLIQNILNENNNKTEIIYELKKEHAKGNSLEYLDKDNSIGIGHHSILNKLITFIKINNCKLEINNKTIKASGSKIQIPSNYKLEDMYAVETYLIKGGILVKKADVIHTDANKRKIIISNKRGYRGAFIDDGRLSLCGKDKYYILGNNLELILKMSKFKIMNIIIYSTKYNQDFLNSESFNYFPDIRKMNMNDIDENEFYKLIGFTEEEIKTINNF